MDSSVTLLRNADTLSLIPTCFSKDKSGSSFNTPLASLLAISNISLSDSFAILRSGRPLCLVPKKSPGPLSSRSTSASLNPSLIFSLVPRDRLILGCNSFCVRLCRHDLGIGEVGRARSDLRSLSSLRWR